jgi:hypothetical protein
MKTSPTQRSLKLLRAAGCICFVCERWVPFARKRIDAFGFGDILVCRLDRKAATLVQTTTRSNQAARRTKILAIPAAKQWLLAENCIETHGWSKMGPRGKRKVWTCNVEKITLADFDGVEPIEEFNPD